MSFPCLPFFQTIGGGTWLGFSAVDGVVPVATEGGSMPTWAVSWFSSSGFGGSR